MPWCPKCKEEFREGFTVCKSCSEQLVEKLDEEPNMSVEAEYKDEEWVLLLSAENDIEADSMEAFLNSCEIPVIRKHGDFSTIANVYTGKSNFGAELYVPESKLEEAKTLIANDEEILDEECIPESDIGEQQENTAEQYNGATEKVVYNKNRRAVAWILLLIIGVPIVIGVTIGVVDFLSRIAGK